MDKLFQYSSARIQSVTLEFKRYLLDKITWNNRLIALTGARGIGKTTLLLQFIKENLNKDSGEVIYASLDDLYFSKTTLVEFADEFVKRGGRYLFFDEIHKYRNWSQEIKNIYDYFSELKIVITGSSALDIYKGAADLSRRAVLYRMQGLSFREFIHLKYGHQFPVLELENLLGDPAGSITPVLKVIKPIRFFEEYIQKGYYPFFIEDEQTYFDRLRQTVNHILDSDLPSVEKIDFVAVHHLRTLLSIISEIVPFKPNILKLSQQVGVSRETLTKYIYLLTRADLLLLLQSGNFGISRMNKPEKIYLNNPNLMYAISYNQVNAGTVRETFLFNQLKNNHKIAYTDKGDFLVDNKYIIETGGKNKPQKQIAGIDNAYIAADNIEFAYQNKIPLWLFGFLY
ncbi:MAG TPA: AAA family ATPase [Bacteroidales bacterium]|nr:AAA family ATPase [Bacteroidales bacterium]HNS47110.1 AAA family ATPase [Bacteroidales bacterium]